MTDGATVVVAAAVPGVPLHANPGIGIGTGNVGKVGTGMGILIVGN